jgi:YtfJ family uncharacterized protein
MINFRTCALLILFSLTVNALADTPTIGSPVTELKIEDKGELVYSNDEFEYQAWNASSNPGKVHVIQYFGANFGDRDIFAPFTDRLQVVTPPGSVHVTTVLNLDAALWGTSGIVTSELKKNKKRYPDATIVVDKQGKGVEAWGLGKAGTGLIILDNKGVVQLFSGEALSQSELGPAFELIKQNIVP